MCEKWCQGGINIIDWAEDTRRIMMVDVERLVAKDQD
jgi:hypothetical protein